MCLFYTWVARSTVESLFRSSYYWETFHGTFIYTLGFLPEGTCFKIFVCSICLGVWKPALGVISQHTYIHNSPVQPFSQDYGLPSHTTHVVCVNFVRKWRNLQFNVDSERQNFEKLFHGNFIYSQSFCQKSAEMKSPKKYFSYLIFLMTDLGYELRLLRLISRHTKY